MTPIYLLWGLVLAVTHASPFCDQYNGTFPCFSTPVNCKEDECVMSMVAFGNETDTTRFILSGNSSGWIAMGLSGNKEMGEDDVLMCIRNGSDNIDVVHRWNTQTRTNVAASGLNATTLQKGTTSYENAILKCEFTRTNVIADPQVFAIGVNKTWFLFFGRGPIAPDTMIPQKHTYTPWISDNKVDFTVASRITVTDMFTSRPTSSASNTLARTPTIPVTQAPTSHGSTILPLSLAFLVCMLAGVILFQKP